MIATRPGPDQFCLTCLQVINWGVFDGYHRIDFSANGTLITGASGSGKSSLLDAISLGFLAHNRRNFNASGDNTAMGSSAGRRTVDKYVRGAWAEMQEGPTRRPMYLRGAGPTWSAVALTYSTLSGDAITGVVLRWFPTATAARTDHRYYLKSGAHDIRELCNTWAERTFDSRVFTEQGWRGGDSELHYLSRLYATIGIVNSDAAQLLLGKAKSLKSVGSLDQFVREFMLDEPNSIREADEALKQIDPLVQARNILKVARDKRRILGDIEQHQLRYTVESGRIGVLDVIDSQMITDYLDALRKQRIGPEIARLDAEIDDLGQVQTRLGGDRARLDRQRTQLIGQITAANRDIEPLRAQRGVAEERLDRVTDSRNRYDDAVYRLGYPPPDDPHDFASLREDLHLEADQISAQVAAVKLQYHAAITAHGDAQKERQAIAGDLERVRQKGSALTRSALGARSRIADALRLSEDELPYVAELVDLKPDQDRWRVAVEKVLHSAGLTLLVPERHYRAVLQIVNAENMKSLIRLRNAQHGDLRQPSAGSLADKLRLVRPEHECAAEALNFLTDTGDYTCVDSPDELGAHRRAVTDQGLTTTGPKSARKDDSRPITASSYIFLGNIEMKIDALEHDLAAATERLEAAHLAMTSKEDELEEHRQRLRACEEIRGFTHWSEVDVATAQAELDRIDNQIRTLEDENPDLVALQEQADQLKQAVEGLSEHIGTVKKTIEESDNLRTELAGIEELLQRRQSATIPGAPQDTLDQYTADCRVELNLLDPSDLRDALTDRVKAERERLYDNRNQARRALENIITNFDVEFPDAIPNDGTDFDAKVADYVALCRSIEERALPQAHDQMMKLITTQAPEAIGNLKFLADNEQDSIRRQIAKVNTGLRAVEFNHGTRLTLRADPKQLRAVQEFNERVAAIYRRAAEVAAGDPQAILDQYTDILRLRQKLGGTQPEDRDWARDALDVRKRFLFYCIEETDAGDVIRTHSNSNASSGSEQEKLMAFCLAGALSFNLAKADTDDLRPVFAQLMLDEAFSKSDPQFAHQALSAFRKFGFQLVIVSTLQNANTIEPYIDSVVMVSKRAEASAAGPTASARAMPITEFKQQRDEHAAARSGAAAR
ncbi:ATP-binding protein [Mycobacterium sherrisii]|uniref:ATP-binding protein n=1 Tax=Mycobacterium sherrisii TaxID=243061 RepID=UPI002DDD40BF|nr:ATP-binding protein [Mycobacterium sherrisii]MEC4764058.1 ATP-binding protein [Mycobacterium sherrisii]